MTTLLEAKELDVSYGHIAAVKGIDFTLKAGEITSLVGANGTGKSTTLSALSGLIPKSQGNVRGQILFESEDITQWSAHKRVKRGIVQVAEGRATLTTMTVRGDLELGACTRNTHKDCSQITSDLERVFHLFPRLKERIDGLVGNLSGGEQQMFTIGQVLMTRPRVLLLDEPLMGLAPITAQEIFRILCTVSAEGLTIFLIEQNVRQTPKIAQHGYTLEIGKIMLVDNGKSLLSNPHVLEAYLGD